MIRATEVLAAGDWRDAAADTVVLEFDDRHRRRTVLTGTGGLAFLLDLPDAVLLRGGDALRLEDGRLVEVVSAPESLVEIKGRHPGDLVRLAWHIGNRHLPAQLMPHAIRIRQDHVIEDMLRGLGAKLVSIEGPFDPEGGAYASAGSHAHDATDAVEHKHHDHGHHHHKHDDGDSGHKHHQTHDGGHKHHHHGHKHGHDH